MVRVPPGHTPSNVDPPGAAHALGCYYVNLFSNSIQRQCNPLNAISLAVLGYVGKDGTPAGAFNAFDTWDQAKSFADQWRIIKGIGGAAGGIPLPGGSTGGGGGGSSGDSGQTDWTHLAIRLAEFGIGIILVIIGFNAIVAKTKVGQKIEVVATGVASRAVK